ncbi:MAG TPA: SPFH domain-containing protein [Thermotogota bacterium]|jgi:membrane protease subunit (stomatin/prohibitin family)|nr:MAG: Double zinc ribbon [Thermotogota bacterium ADurb.Bin062]HNW47758.1 SPFH domain-containing protein [Thermotogota bacterium]HNY83119.1 SPFH domain-containing protein [Thermotogota bacterium]HOD92231.1 SPFH domain-containing protein [Thermotogota bacterium]HOF24506.1 SPFH domain-containing protein [Thermotogota bacterium]
MRVADIIQYEGDNKTLVWKHPTQDFNTTTQLIVHESQEALFFKNGQALDLFPSGRYTLETQNIPLIKRILNLPTGGKTPFHSEVYFINKTNILNVKWGTSTRAEVFDPKFQILLNVGASGAMGISVGDARKFVVKLVGTETGFSLEQLSVYFKELISTRVKAYLARIMNEVSFVVVNSHLNDISFAVKNQLSEDMQEYGILLPNFFISTIHVPDEDKQKVKEALSTASARAIEGYNWVDEQISEIAKKYATRTGTSGQGIDWIAQAPVAFAFGQMLKESMHPFMNRTFANTAKAFGESRENPTSGAVEGKKNCPKCGAVSPLKAAFCSQCGFQYPEKLCSKCGNKINDGDKFCSQCGTPTN